LKFRRGKSDQAEDGAQVETSESASVESRGPVERPAVRAEGPWDISEVEIDEEDPNRIDLGGLILSAHPSLELQMQVDESSGQVMAVLLAGPEGAAELRPFAAPRNGDIWADTRRSIASDVTQQGGTATEADGPFGKELHVMMTVQTPDGSTVQQPSRVIGIAGPRWLLRVTMFGRPALEFAEDGDIESALRDVVVVRGHAPMPPGDPLPLTVPANAQRNEGP
jgi:Protein of unknown function (DUF3710)